MYQYVLVVAILTCSTFVLARPLGPQPEREFEGKIGFSATADTLLNCGGDACAGGEGLGGLFGGVGGQNCAGLPGSTVVLDDIPETDTLTIVHARLNWAATVPSMGVSDDVVSLTPPGGEPFPVDAEAELSESFEDSADDLTCMILRSSCGPETVCAMKHYSNWADITQPLQDHLEDGGTLNGDWTFSDVVIPGSDGTDPQRAAAAFASNTIGAWSLIIVYRDPVNLPTRRLYFYRGLELISGTDITLNPSGFTAPPNPEADIALMVLEGDANIMGDGARVNVSRLSDECNPAQNLFNSTVNTGRADGECRTDVTGVDLDRFVVPNAIAEGDENAQVELTFSAGGLPGLTPTEQLFTNWMIVAFDHLLPNFDAVKPEKESAPPDGSTVNPGDVIRYIIRLTNRGDAPATNVVLRDSVPRGTTYIASSAKLDDRPFADDNGMQLPLESGVTLTDLSIVGDEIEVGESHVFEFSVTVNNDAPDGFEITNIAYIEADLVGELRTEPVRHTVRVLDEEIIEGPDAGTPAGAGINEQGGESEEPVRRLDSGLMPVVTAGAPVDEDMSGTPAINRAPDLSAQCGDGTRLNTEGQCIAIDRNRASGCTCDSGRGTSHAFFTLVLVGLSCLRRIRRL